VLVDCVYAVADACREPGQCAVFLQFQVLAGCTGQADQRHRVTCGAGFDGVEVGDPAGHCRVGSEPLPLLLRGLAQLGERATLHPGLLGHGGIGPAHIAAQPRGVHKLPRTVGTALHLIGRAPETFGGMDDPEPVAEGPDFVAQAFMEDVRPPVRRAIQASRIRSGRIQRRSAVHLISPKPGWLRLRRRSGFSCVRKSRVQHSVQLGQAAERVERVGQCMSNPGIVMGVAGQLGPHLVEDPARFLPEQGKQGGFNRSSQHWIVVQTLDTHSVLRQVFSSRVFFEV